MSTNKMTTNRPYLIRAFYEWIVDNNLTPYILVNADDPRTQVPEQYIEDGHIVLNISPRACQGLHIDNDRLIFSARFSGVAMQIVTPPEAVLAIYAKENGQGMAFADEENGGDTEPTPPAAPHDTTSAPGSKKSKPKLTVVK